MDAQLTNMFLNHLEYVKEYVYASTYHISGNYKNQKFSIILSKDKYYFLTQNNLVIFSDSDPQNIIKVWKFIMGHNLKDSLSTKKIILHQYVQ